ncbi:hypothetical protein GCM10009539_05320 [Cryptosporangium japonicum]|uniref:Nitroreductase n=1 Tax=Cryptosporangium japonicum TaxID=80872 RepID=A0ABP3D4D4_9ACTN
MLRTAGGGALGLAVVGSGTLGWRAYDNGVFDPDGGTAFDAWRRWRDDDGPRGTIAAAVLAASPHNTQPWLFRASASRIELWADPERVMRSVDPYRREQRTSLGSSGSLPSPANSPPPRWCGSPTPASARSSVI